MALVCHRATRDTGDYRWWHQASYEIKATPRSDRQTDCCCCCRRCGRDNCRVQSTAGCCYGHSTMRQLRHHPQPRGVTPTWTCEYGTSKCRCWTPLLALWMITTIGNVAGTCHCYHCIYNAPFVAVGPDVDRIKLGLSWLKQHNFVIFDVFQQSLVFKCMFYHLTVAQNFTQKAARIAETSATLAARVTMQKI